MLFQNNIKQNLTNLNYIYTHTHTYIYIYGNSSFYRKNIIYENSKLYCNSKNILKLSMKPSLCLKYIAKYSLQLRIALIHSNTMRFFIWYHLYNLKNIKNTMEECYNQYSCIKSNTPPWMFFTFFEFYKCYQITQRILNSSSKE